MGAPEGLALAVVAVLLLAWSLVGQRMEGWGITAPMAFLAAGVLLAATAAEDVDPQTVRFLAEITLVVILFHDASTVRLADLRADPWIAVRLLAVGFPVALMMTTAATHLLLPAVGLAGAVLVAGAITPTDAGLGAPTIMNPVVPTRVRRALNVESGLNDGLATPVVLGALAVLVEASGRDEQTILSLAAVPVLLGLGIGTLLGIAGAWLLDTSHDRGWSSTRARGIAVLALPLLSFGLAEVLEANAFIAAFVGGLLFGRFAHCVEIEAEVSETLEIAADLLSSVLWLLAGALLVGALSSGLEWQWVASAVLALTLLRAVPVAIGLAGSGFRWPTVLFLGWFGPRGIATIVFGLITVETLDDEALLLDVGGVLSVTVLLSVVLHGVTAGPLSIRYGAWVARAHGPIETEPSVEPMPSRGRGMVGG
jgi:NhaP-type Na+/H+ or K+/H+ antiporter